jgi:hypothetical protein
MSASIFHSKRLAAQASQIAAASKGCIDRARYSEIRRASVEKARGNPIAVSHPSAAADGDRVARILNHPEARLRETLAEHIAHKTDMSADAAIAALTASAKQYEIRPDEYAGMRRAAVEKARGTFAGAQIAADSAGQSVQAPTRLQPETYAELRRQAVQQARKAR